MSVKVDVEQSTAARNEVSVLCTLMAPRLMGNRAMHRSKRAGGMKLLVDPEPLRTILRSDK